MNGTRPLPEWTMTGYGGPYEANDPHGVTWRLWHAPESAPGDPHPAGYRLAPAGNLAAAEYVTAEHGLYHALDMAGMRIAADAVRGDPEGAVLQLGLTPMTRIPLDDTRNRRPAPWPIPVTSLPGLRRSIRS